LSADSIEEIAQSTERFKKFCSVFDEYKGDYLRMFAQLTEEVITQAVDKLTKELDGGAEEFVNIVFRSEFE
jgi:superfamily I DNA and RNA helicase